MSSRNQNKDESRFNENRGDIHPHPLPAYVSRRQHTSACVSIRTPNARHPHPLPGDILSSSENSLGTPLHIFPLALALSAIIK